MEEKTYRLKKLIKELESTKGRHTQLVTVYVPAGYSISDISNQIKNEQGTAINIKSKGVRKNVVSALERIVQHLKLYKQTPPNGLALFSGNVSENEGEGNVEIWFIEPPEPLKVKLYWCDQKFELGPLMEMVKEKEVFGLLVMDTQEATFGMLRGKQITVLRRLDSIVPGKTAKGGQSAQRFERVRDGLLNDFYKEIAQTAVKFFGDENKGILLGGPGPSKTTFFDGDYLQTAIKNKVIGVRDTGYTDEHGLHELVERSADLMVEASVAKERKLMQDFFSHLQRETGMITYGMIAVLKALELGAVDTIILSEGTDWEEIELQCSCGYAEKKMSRISEKNKHKCPKCGQPMRVIGEMDIVDAFEELSKKYGTKLEVVSRDTREGDQLFQIGGIGAFLRWRL